MKYIEQLGGLENPPFTSDYNVINELVYASGTGRNAMDGTYTGVLIGSFPQITGKFPSNLEDEVYKSIIAELKKQEISVQWYDLTTSEFKTGIFKPSFSGTGRDLNNRNKEISFTLTSIRRE